MGRVLRWGGRYAEPSTDLAALTQRVWGLPDSPVRAAVGPAPDGFDVLEEYVVVPRASAARWLLPLGARHATLSSLLRYSAMKPRPLRVARTAMAGVFGTGAGYRTFPDRVTVSIHPGVPRHEHARWLLLSHLSETLGHRELFASIDVRRANPNAKPTLQLFDRRGVPVGYAKVGWSPGTRRLVQAEASALQAVGGRIPQLVTPHLLADGRWQDREYSVASPLPEHLRRWRSSTETAPRLQLEVFSSGPAHDSRLADSRYAAKLRAELTDAAPDEPEATRTLLTWLDVLLDNDALLKLGRWHGDWVPWNLGYHRGEVAAWDWEHSAAEAPLGFDLLHWHFQQAVPASGLDAAVEAVRRVEHQLAALDVPPQSRPLVTALYLLEMFARVTRMAVGGGGWNPRFHPRMLEVAHDWATHRRDLER